jgi:hypothetical protein
MEILIHTMFLWSVFYLVFKALETKNNFLFIAIIFILVLLYHYNNYKDLSKIIIKESNITLKQIPYDYKTLYIDLKSDIEKDKVLENNELNNSK